MIRHENGFEGKSEDPLCKSCNKSFQTKWHLKRHQAKIHSNKKRKKTETKSKYETASTSTSIEPFIDLCMILEYLDSSDTDDDFVPTMVPLVDKTRDETEIDFTKIGM